MKYTARTKTTHILRLTSEELDALQALVGQFVPKFGSFTGELMSDILDIPNDGVVPSTFDNLYSVEEQAEGFVLRHRE